MNVYKQKNEKILLFMQEKTPFSANIFEPERLQQNTFALKYFSLQQYELAYLEFTAL